MPHFSPHRHLRYHNITKRMNINGTIRPLGRKREITFTQRYFIHTLCNCGGSLRTRETPLGSHQPAVPSGKISKPLTLMQYERLPSMWQAWSSGSWGLRYRIPPSSSLHLLFLFPLWNWLNPKGSFIFSLWVWKMEQCSILRYFYRPLFSHMSHNT